MFLFQVTCVIPLVAGMQHFYFAAFVCSCVAFVSSANPLSIGYKHTMTTKSTKQGNTKQTTACWGKVTWVVIIRISNIYIKGLITKSNTNGLSWKMFGTSENQCSQWRYVSDIINYRQSY